MKENLLNSAIAVCLTIALVVGGLPLAVSSSDAPTISLGQVVVGNVFTTQQDVQVEVFTDASVVRYKVIDFWDNLVAEGVHEVNSSSCVITIEMSKKGVFRLIVSAVGVGGVTQASETTFAIVDPIDLRDVSEDSPFCVQTHLAKETGITAIWRDMENVLDMVALLGFKKVRNTIRWGELEKNKGVYQFVDQPRVDFDKFMQQLKDRNMQLYFVAADYNSNYDTWEGDYYEGFANYVAAIMQQYPGQLKWIEVLNEPNGSHSPVPGNDVFERGASYAKLLKVVYEKVKEIDATAKVVGGATVDNGRDFMRGMFRADNDGDGKADGTKYADAVSFHWYQTNPVAARGTMIETQKMLSEEFQSSVPVYLSETGLSTIPNGADSMEANDMGENVRRHATFLPVQLVDAVATSTSGDGLVSLYELLNDTANRNSLEDNFGLFRAIDDPVGSFTPRWSFGTMAVMNRMLNGYEFSKFTEMPSASSTIYNEYLFKKGAEELRFMHTYSGKYKITANASAPVELVDMMGNSVTLVPQSGKVSFEMDECPVYLKGTVSGITHSAAEKARVYEGESVTVAVDKGSQNNASGQQYLSRKTGRVFTPNAEGGYIEYTLEVPENGFYKVYVRSSRKPDRGKYTITLDGQPVKEMDFAGGVTTTYIHSEYLGTFQMNQGQRKLRFAVKDYISTKRTLLVDMIMLEKQPEQSLQITAPTVMGLDAFPRLATVDVDKQVVWNSSNKNVIDVKDGWLFPVGVGQATITATVADGVQTGSVVVKVEKYAVEHSITLEHSRMDVKLGEFQMQAQISPMPATEPIIWSSSNEQVATVDQRGVVTPIAIGSTIITAVYGNSQAVCAVNVIEQDILLTKTTITHNIGSNSASEVVNPSGNPSEVLIRNIGGQHRVGFFGMDLSAYENAQIKAAQFLLCYKDYPNWFESGGGSFPVYAYSAPWEETTITYNDSNGSTVLEEDLVGTIQIPAGEANITTDKFYGIDITDYLNELEDNQLSFKMLGDKSGGRYKFHARGAEDVDKRPRVRIEVEPPEEEELTLSEEYLSISLEPVKLTALINGQTPYVPISWSSDNTSVATVDSTGTVTPRGIGTAVITAQYGIVSDNCTVNVLGAEYQFTKNTAIYSTGTDAGTVIHPDGATEMYLRNVGGSMRVGLLGLDLSSLEGKTIKKATLSLNYRGFSNDQRYYVPGGAEMSLYAYNEQWEEATATYNNAGGASVSQDDLIGKIAIPPGAVEDVAEKFYSIDVTQYLNDLTDKNLSIKLMGDSTTKQTSATNDVGRYIFHGRRSQEVEKRPKLIIEVEQDPYIKVDYEFYDKQQNAVDQPTSEGTVKAIAEVMPANDCEEAWMMFALYDQERMKSIGVEKYGLSKEGKQTIEVQLEDLPENVEDEDYSYKLLIWLPNMQAIFRDFEQLQVL